MLLCCATALAFAGAADARPWPCLPPVFDGGQRLHEMPSPTVFWLELLLRQHEICWREPATPGELRVVLIGNSAVYGMPHPAEKTFASRLNRHFSEQGIPARLFNLGFVYTFQVRDAFVIHEALRYEPDVIVYPLSLSDFIHLPLVGFPFFARFFESNQGIARELVDDPPPGLREPFERNRDSYAGLGALDGLRVRLREAGAFLRAAVRVSADHVAERLDATPLSAAAAPLERFTSYDCARTLAINATEFDHWQQWNILAYLEEIQHTRGIDVLVVDWPVAHEPVGACYNVRYGSDVFADYVAWLSRETRARGLHLLDLHDRLPPEAFLDSLHLGPEGHERVADEIARVLDPILAERIRTSRRSAHPPRREPSG